MTGVAAHALINMNAVVEINEVGQVVDPGPHQRIAAAKTFPYRFQQPGVRPYLRVAIHASPGGRNSSEARGFDRSMAVAAINSQSGHMMLMAERDRLRPRHFSVSNIGRALQLQHRPEQRRDQENRPVNRGTGDCVRAAMKNLHGSELSVQWKRHVRCWYGFPSGQLFTDG